MKPQPTSPNLTLPSFIRWGFLALSMMTFLLSLCLECFTTEGGSKTSGPGFFLFVMGALGIFDGLVAWFANPLLLFSWLLMNFRYTRGVALILNLLAIPIGLSFLMAKSMLLNEGGSRTPITGYSAGFYLWIASMVLALFGSFAALFVPYNRMSRN